ncbi:hypothetical protein [Helicobacter ailurogastricus]|uniref:Periplasmic protein n=1 Tax=Helicobacter ailurogastricus TaxID=1578720 RepID=A0A0K2X6Q2_9HELI|nr:hypothetical protein [Helicobacter ailurogastricus]CRF40364.1 hypothetical protein HAL011_01180 [Helicobacter ailurogastricus]CRF43013.1 hypothetical protein HAL013_12340 [Helicobacter ailurogastricus]CRF44721.1 hypothetical protein HAL09_13290 [Helicobacter ailurogastricus]
MRGFLFGVLLCALLNADVLDVKIKSLMDRSFYQTNQNFIRRIFEDRAAFYDQGALRIRKVLVALKDNGLLPLKFDRPALLQVRFVAKTSPLLLLKTIQSVLSSMGYAYFSVLQVQRQEDTSSATFSLNTEYALDPTLAAKLFAKYGFNLVDLERKSLKDWAYSFSVQTPHLAHATPLIPTGHALELKEISGEYWLDITSPGRLLVFANASLWQPQVSLFDASLHIIKYMAAENPTEKISLHIGDKVRFVRVSDVNNPLVLKGGIKVLLQPTRH